MEKLKEEIKKIGLNVGYYCPFADIMRFLQKNHSELVYYFNNLGYGELEIFDKKTDKMIFCLSVYKNKLGFIKID